MTMKEKRPSLFFDIDGTLVSFKTHAIPHSTVEALTQAKRNGARIYISTGRPLNIINNLGAIEHLIDGYITVNGAYIVVDGQTVSCHPISPEDVAWLLADAHTNDYACIISGEHDMVVYNPKDIVREVFIDQLAVTRLDFDTPPEQILHTQRILQLSPFFSEQYEQSVLKALPHCVSGRWHPAFTDITSRQADKGKGLVRLAEHEQIDLADTFAFGDGGNDLSIIRTAGTGIAMGNAIPSLKEQADYVTTSVDDDGISLALQHFEII